MLFIGYGADLPLAKAEFCAGDNILFPLNSLICERTYFQAGAIRRRYSQVAKKSLSQLL
jgi:hypothetical protein